ncbi:MAG: flavin reductase family protein [Rhizobacter sp.]|nr:flavin reductase family protein [Chlorobiales bacterium]
MKTLLKPSDVSPQDFYKILIGSVLPRPIAWVSTLSKSGVDNLAPFSFFTVASANPPVLCFAPAIRSLRPENKSIGTEKDTLVNVRETKEFVVNIVSRHLVNAMNQTSAEYDLGVSEFEMAGLTKTPSELVKPKCVAESFVNMECKLYQILEIGTEPMGGSLVLGEIVAVHLDDQVYKDGKIDIEVLDPIARLGGLWYSSTADRFELPRPTLPVSSGESDSQTKRNPL